MTARLSKALQQLPVEEIEKVADFAEFLASRRKGATPEEPQYLKLDWAGKAADAYPEHQSGVEAQHAITQMRIEALDRASKG